MVRVFFSLACSWMNNDMHKMLQMTEGPHTQVGGGGYPTKPSYHLVLIRMEMKTLLLEVSFLDVFVIVLFLNKGRVLLPFFAAFGLLLISYINFQ